MGSCFKVFRRGNKNSYTVNDAYEQSSANARYSIHSRYSSVYENSPGEGNGDVRTHQKEHTETERNDKLMQIQAGLDDENRNQQKAPPTISVTTSEEVQHAPTETERSYHVETETVRTVTTTEREVEEEEEEEEREAEVERESNGDVLVEQAVRRTSVSSSEADRESKTGSAVEIHVEETRTDDFQEGSSDHELDSTAAGTWDSRPNNEASVVEVTTTTTTVVRTVERDSTHSDHSSESYEDVHPGQEQGYTLTTDDEPQVTEQTNVSVIRIASSSEQPDLSEREEDERSDHHSEDEQAAHRAEDDALVSVVQVSDSTEAVATFTTEDSDEYDDDEELHNRHNEEAEFQSSVVVVTHDEVHVPHETDQDDDRFDSRAMVY